MVRTLRFHCRGQGSVPGRGTKILQAARHGQKKSKGTRTPVFIAALFIIAKTSKQPTGLRRCDIFIYNGILLSHKKNEILPVVTTWMDLEGILLSEVSQK